jgi:hypothetical protein
MLERNELVRSTINPEALAVVNSVFLKYLIPCALTLLIGNSFFHTAWNRRLRAQNQPFPSQIEDIPAPDMCQELKTRGPVRASGRPPYFKVTFRYTEYRP